MSPETSIPVVKKEDPKSVAAAVLEAAFARDEYTEEVVAAIAADSIWCYSCGREKPKTPKHMGIFFVKDPRGQQVFGPGDWYAVYHDNAKKDDVEQLDDILCQQCFAETGERVHLRLTHAQGPSRHSGVHFRIDESWMQRFAHEVKRKDMEAWLEKKKAKTNAARTASK